MNEFQKDEKVQELKIKPIDYGKLNKLYDDFVPQKELYAEQTYFPSSFISSEEFYFETKPSMASMPSANPMLMDLNEMENVFKNSSLAEDVKNLVITSCVEIRNKDLHDEIERILKESKDVSNESKTADMVCNDAFEVTQELSKRIVELEKDLSKFEAKIQRSKVESNQCDEVKVKVNFEIETKNIKLEHRVSSLLKENEHLKLVYKNLFDSIKKTCVQKENLRATKDFDDVKLELSNRTAKFEAYFEKLEKTKVVLERQLARKVDDSKSEKDRVLKEINHLRTQLKNLKGKHVETKLDNSSILGKPPLLNNERDQLLKQIAILESKLASQDIRSCQKEYHELRTSYNALKVKFDSLNLKKWNINVSKSSKPKESVSEKVYTASTTIGS
ncbi:hypothetical protein Tco_0462600 [Tanacetum coccineum]